VDWEASYVAIGLRGSQIENSYTGYGGLCWDSRIIDDEKEAWAEFPAFVPRGTRTRTPFRVYSHLYYAGSFHWQKPEGSFHREPLGI